MKLPTSICLGINQSRRVIAAGVGVSMLVLATTGVMAAASITTDRYSYLPGETITALFAGGPGNNLDWVGVYPEGSLPGQGSANPWAYVYGATEGTVSLTGPSFPQNYNAYFLQNNGYTILAEVPFRVLDPGVLFVRSSKRTYNTDTAISIVFTNGPGNPKDWVAIYAEGSYPGNGSAVLWKYVDGTTSGLTGRIANEIVFSGGLSAATNYVAYLLLDNGYTALASDPFSVVQPANPFPTVTAFSPADGSKNVDPLLAVSATLKNGAKTVNTNTVSLTLDGAAVPVFLTQNSVAITVGYTNSIPLTPDSTHTVVLRFADDASPANWYTNQSKFIIARKTTISTDRYTYLVGENIYASWSGGPANRYDWIAFYKGSLPGVGSAELWKYTDGSNGYQGVADGALTFANGLPDAGARTAYFLVNNGYTIQAQADIRVVDPLQTFLRSEKRFYATAEPISIVFSNSPGNPKDKIAIYAEGTLPSGGSPILWSYVDGTQTGTLGVTNGRITFHTGLSTTTNYVAYLLLDNGTTILDSDPFSVEFNPTLSVTKDGADIVISWSSSANAFTLESTPSLQSPVWTVIRGLGGTTQYRTPAVDGPGFFRLRR